ncbi:hypothetical protein [Pseudoxanthomonas putridarboris]|uniref:Uncharacterized protein n=1 Tax=Pseudoxanthomonas putridarboris TaxID=752605 RepID=A0ABU9IZY2_9GAMM
MIDIHILKTRLFAIRAHCGAIAMVRMEWSAVRRGAPYATARTKKLAFFA